LITVLVRTTLKDSTPQQVFQDVMTWWGHPPLLLAGKDATKKGQVA
jgi:hypothetical protein